MASATQGMATALHSTITRIRLRSSRHGRNDRYYRDAWFGLCSATVQLRTRRIRLGWLRALAYRLGLLYPDRFAGVISLNGALPRRGGPLLKLPDVRKLRVLIGHGIANPIIPLTLARRDCRLLYTAGVDVRLHTYATTHRLHPDMLRDANRWILDGVNAEQGTVMSDAYPAESEY